MFLSIDDASSHRFMMPSIGSDRYSDQNSLDSKTSVVESDQYTDDSDSELDYE